MQLVNPLSMVKGCRTVLRARGLGGMLRAIAMGVDSRSNAIDTLDAGACFRAYHQFIGRFQAAPRLNGRRVAERLNHEKTTSWECWVTLQTVFLGTESRFRLRKDEML